jgi:hypothetical protein
VSLLSGSFNRHSDVQCSSSCSMHEIVMKFVEDYFSRAYCWSCLFTSFNFIIESGIMSHSSVLWNKVLFGVIFIIISLSTVEGQAAATGHKSESVLTNLELFKFNPNDKKFIKIPPKNAHKISKTAQGISGVIGVGKFRINRKDLQPIHAI